MIRVDAGVVLLGVALLAAAAAQDLIPATRLVPVKWPFLTAVALYCALTRPPLVALTAAVWAGMLADALGGIPQGCTGVFLALVCVAARLFRKVFVDVMIVQGIVLMAAAAPLQQVWTRMWVKGTGVPVFSLEMLRLAAVSAGVGLAVVCLVFLALGRLERFAGVAGAKPGAGRPWAQHERGA